MIRYTAVFENTRWWVRTEGIDNVLGPFANEADAQEFVANDGLWRRNNTPPWLRYTPPPPPRVPSIPRKYTPPDPPDPRFGKPPEPRYGLGFQEFEEQQWGWQRRHALLRAYRTGATYTELAAFTGFSPDFVNRLIARAERDEIANRKAPFCELRDRNVFWTEQEARLFVRSLDRSLTLDRRTGRDWLYLASPGFQSAA